MGLGAAAEERAPRLREAEKPEQQGGRPGFILGTVGN